MPGLFIDAWLVLKNKITFTVIEYMVTEKFAKQLPQKHVPFLAVFGGILNCRFMSIYNNHIHYGGTMQGAVFAK